MNFFDPSGWANGQSFEAARHAQREGPVRWVPGADVLAVLGHVEALEVLSDSERFTSRRGTGLAAGGTTGRSLNLDDPPRSLELRRLLQTVMDQPETSESRRLLVQSANDAVSRAQARGEFDALSDLAAPVARASFGRLFGLEADELTLLCRLTEGLARSGRDRLVQQGADDALRSFLRAGLAESRTGAFWDLGRAAMERGLTNEDAMFLLRLVVQTGHESTAQAIAGAIHAALEHQLPFDSSPRALEEWLRWTSPLIRFARVATRRTTVGAFGIAEGARLVVVFPVVNRDPAVFTNPETIDLQRAPNAHLAFGWGPHACAGARLAKQQLAAVLDALREVDRPSLSAPPVRLESAVTHGFVRVPLRFG